MAELYKASPSPCAGCKVQKRKSIQTAVAASRANSDLRLIDSLTSQEFHAERAVDAATKHIIETGAEGIAFFEDLERDGISVPDESHMAGISSRMEAVRQDLTLQEGTLTDLEQERTTIAAACSGPRELKLGLVTVRYCTSTEVPIWQRVSLSDR